MKDWAMIAMVVHVRRDGVEVIFFYQDILAILFYSQKLFYDAIKNLYAPNILH